MPLTAKAARRSTSRSPSPAAPALRWLRILDAVRAELRGDWPIARMAMQVSASARTFQRHVTNVMGMPPGEWLVMQRLAAAKTLLDVDDIAVQVGFGDTAILRGHFRNRLGPSPGGYRKRFRT